MRDDLQFELDPGGVCFAASSRGMYSLAVGLRRRPIP